MNKKIPMRSCIVTKERLPKWELLRIVRTPDDRIIADESGKLNGKGAYIKKDVNVLNMARKNKALERALEHSIDDSVYDEIEKIINN